MMVVKITLAIFICVALLSSCNYNEKSKTLGVTVASDAVSTATENDDVSGVSNGIVKVSFSAETENEDSKSVNESNSAINTNNKTVPDLEFANEYSEACNAYRELLLGQRSAVFNDARQLLYFWYYTFGAVNSEFTLIDINADGIPELHFRSRSYTIFSYRNGEVYVVNVFQQKAELMNNLAIYTDYWARNGITEATHSYTEFGDDMLPCFTFYFSYNDMNGIYRVAYDNNETPTYVSKQEFEVITAPIISYCTDAKNYDMISWTNYGEWLEKNIEEYVRVEHPLE